MMLDIKKISKSFGGVRAVKNSTFGIEKNRITGLIGPNGAGKTTLFDIITGVISADKGKIKLNKEGLLGKRTSKIADMGISRTFQQVRLFTNLTIRDHLYMAMDHDDTKILKNIFGSHKRKKEKEKKAIEILESIGLKKSLDAYAGDLSYGQRKLLDLGMALVKPHKILMLDEPVAGVNPKIRKDIKKILKTLKKNGATILIIEHDMDFIMDICDRIIVLDVGSVLVEGTPKKIQNNKKVLEAYLGE